MNYTLTEQKYLLEGISLLSSFISYLQKERDLNRLLRDW